MAGTVLKYEKNSWVECRTHKHTPLWAAARNGHASTVLVLLQAGARVDAKNKWGETALDIAKEKQHAEVVAILRAAGARE